MFRQGIEYELPQICGLVGAPVRIFAKEVRGLMSLVKFEGFKVDIVAVKEEFPSIHGFAIWLKESSQYEMRTSQ
jgi:hypothetical protein